MGGEEGYGVAHGHFEDVVDILALEFHFENVFLETLAAAFLAFQHEVGHKLHLHLYLPFALARLAASAVGVEREVRRRQVHLPGEGLRCHEFAYLVVGLDVGHGVGARRLADGVLVYKLHRPHGLHVAREAAEGSGAVARLVERALHGAVEDVAHEGRFSRTAHARHRRHCVERKLHVDTFQVVGACALHHDASVPRPAPCRHLNAVASLQPGGSVRLGCIGVSRLFGRALPHRSSAAAARFRADVDNIVRSPDDFLVVLHHDHRVAKVAQLLQHTD